MADDLSEIDERIAYCGAQIDQALQETRDYLSTRVEARHQLPLGHGQSHVRLRVSAPLPVGFRIKVGAIAHELRSVLDSLACVLARRNGQDPKNVYFPISKDKDVFDDDGLRKIKKLSPDDQRKIAELKPWGPDNTLLLGFHKLDTIQKHQRLTLQVAAHVGTGFGANPLTGIGIATSVTINRTGPLTTEWQTIATLGPGTAVNIIYDCQINFGEPEQLRGKDVISGLRDFRNEVARIVELFRQP